MTEHSNLPGMGEDMEDDDFNGRACPYFGRYYNLPGHDPAATCGFGCVDEPSCITDQPRDGWPALDFDENGASSHE